MTGGFRRQVESIPEQLLHEPASSGSPLPGEGRLILSGMGGSALAGEFLTLGLGAQRETLVVRNGFFSAPVRDRDALLVLSYSGRTAEALSIWEAAREHDLPRAAVASGGPLLDLAREDGTAFCQLPAGLAPRTALGYLLRGAWSLCGVRPPDWTAAADHLRGVARRWAGGPRSRAADVSARMLNALPTLFVPEPELGVAGKRWVADLAENAKVPALLWEFPEAAHNQIMAVRAELASPLACFVLGSPWREETARWWDATLEALGEEKVEPERIDEPHPDPFFRALGLAYVGDWVSVLLAERLAVDPSDLSLMDEIKKRIRPRSQRGTS
jgi:glucose/mannose-6-phosphate isomerase